MFPLFPKSYASTLMSFYRFDMYSIPDPPYFLFIAGFLASLASGAAFEAVLKQSVQNWSKSRSTRSLATLQGTQLLLPFLGIAGGVCIFLSSGMAIFGFPSQLAYVISIPLTAFIGLLVWSQLGKILVELERGGSKALDLDSFF
ncbi:hypothetical protein [Leptodesmis sp.]|uniref:hypothetical protein n=1 Tax=Leptodesmis sp. TaxID=3100501 RepID=UPI003D100405